MVLENKAATTSANGEVHNPGTPPPVPEHENLLAQTTPVPVGKDQVVQTQPVETRDATTSWVEDCSFDCWGPKGIKKAGSVDRTSGNDAQQLLNFNPATSDSWQQFWALENTAAPQATDTSTLPATTAKLGDNLSVSVKRDPSGKVVDVKASTPESTTELTRSGAMTTSDKGTIMTDGKGRTIDKSADGDHAYQHMADGEQRFADKNGITAKYSAEKKEADVKMPGDTGVKVHNTTDGSWKDFNGKKVFTSKQSSKEFDKKTMQDDKTYMFTDGVAMVKHDGATSIYKKDGESEVRTKAGNFVVKGDDITFYNKTHPYPDGGLKVTNNNVAAIQAEMAKDGVTKPIIHQGTDGGPPTVDQAKQQGVAIDNHDASAVKVSIPDATTKNDTATATLTDGQVQIDVPNQFKFVDTSSGEQAFNEQPGMQDQPLYGYNYDGTDAGGFYTPDISFNSDGSTDVGWDGTYVDPNGDVDPGDSYDSYSQLSDASADASATNTSVAADTDADTTTDTANADVNSNNIDPADLTSIAGSRDEVQTALSSCMAAGNFQPLSDLEDDLSELDSAQGQVSTKVSKADRLKAAGVTDPDAIAAAEAGDYSQVAASLRQLRHDQDDDDEQRQTA